VNSQIPVPNHNPLEMSNDLPAKKIHPKKRSANAAKKDERTNADIEAVSASLEDEDEENQAATSTQSSSEASDAEKGCEVDPIGASIIEDSGDDSDTMEAINLPVTIAQPKKSHLMQVGAQRRIGLTRTSHQSASSVSIVSKTRFMALEAVEEKTDDEDEEDSEGSSEGSIESNENGLSQHSQKRRRENRSVKEDQDSMTREKSMKERRQR
jgi:hypothetical protein